MPDTEPQLLPGRQTAWDVLVRDEPAPGLAVTVYPCKERVEKMREQAIESIPDEPRVRPPNWTPEWRKALLDEISRALAGSQLPGAWIPALNVPRFVHGQGQGMCELLGASVEKQPDGNYFVDPLGDNLATIDRIHPRPLEESIYWGAVEWIRYATAASRSRFQFRNPVMGGPFDLANCLLGTTRLMEWVYTEPATVHALQEKITEVIIGMYRALKEAAGGTLHALTFGCLANGFDLCSECRSLVSADMFEEFDAPYLCKIGHAVGPYGIHACGSWERTIPCSLRDPNLKGMNGQVRENNLQELCELAEGQVLLSIGPSRDLHERYTWPDRMSFLQYVLETAPTRQAIEIKINESELELFSQVYHRIRG